jgi:hypothetical protein
MRDEMRDRRVANLKTPPSSHGIINRNRIITIVVFVFRNIDVLRS